MKRTLVAAALAVAFFQSAPALAVDASELEQIRAQIAQMKAQYEARIEALEKRLAGAEGTAQAASESARAAQSAAAGAPRAGTPGNAFNPDISLILGGALTRQSRDPETWRLGGFAPPGEPDEIGPPKRRGYSLQESELGLSANIDPNFRGTLTFSLSPENSVEVEEAYVQTLALPAGLNARVGRFLSGIGYQNEQHAHVWDFADTPLAYTAFFGNRLVAEGAQLKWLAPSETFFELGLEAGRDDNFPGSGRNKKGSGLGALFAHLGGDVGIAHSWRAGLSLVRTTARQRSYEDSDSLGIATNNAFSGRSRTAVADFVWKWAPQGNARGRSFKLAGEYFQRREDGSLSCSAEAGSGGNCEGGFADGYRSRQSGYYLQGVYQFAPQWRVGYRFDQLDSGTTAIGLVDNALPGFNATPFSAADFGLLAAYRPKRHTLMTDWNPSEFSRIRLQFARDSSRPGEADSQLWLQYVMSLGAHGAHKF